MTIFSKGVLGEYTKEFVHLMPKKTVFILLLMVLISLAEAAGLLLLIPLLQLVGLDTGQGSLDQISQLIFYVFNSLGIPLNLFIVLGIYVLVVSVNAILHRYEMVLGYEIDYKFAAHLRKRLFRAITTTKWLFFSRNKSSNFTHALTNEIERIGTGTSQYLTLLSGIMILVVYIIFALKLAGWYVGLIFLAGVVLLLFLRNKAYSSRSTGEEITSSTRELYSSITQHLDGMKTIKSFGIQEENIKVFSDQTDRVVGSYLDTIRNYADVKLLFDVGTVFILALMVLFLIQVIQISTATLLVLIYLFVRMVPQFSTIQSSYQYVLNMLPAYSNVKDLEKQCLKNSEPSDYEMEEILPTMNISLENISFSYQDEHFAMNDLNLTIPAGKVTAIAGPSGAGKTTIADLVMGLIQPSGGMVALDGEPLNNNWKSRIGYVAQDTFLFNDTIRFNLLLARPEANEKDLNHALSQAAAYEFVSKLPEGLDTTIGDRGVRLSGGERQRLALARALLRKPALLILDEATSNIDSENEKRIMDAITSLQGDITILVIAHRLSIIKNADLIYLMEEGRVVEQGTWEELLVREKVWF